MDVMVSIVGIGVWWAVTYYTYMGAATVLDKVFTFTNNLEYSLVAWWEAGWWR
jgi:hypothetical protein